MRSKGPAEVRIQNDASGMGQHCVNKVTLKVSQVMDANMSDGQVFSQVCLHRIDETMKNVAKHPQASWWPGEVVTLGVLCVFKNTDNCVFYR